MQCSRGRLRQEQRRREARTPAVDEVATMAANAGTDVNVDVNVMLKGSIRLSSGCKNPHLLPLLSWPLPPPPYSSAPPSHASMQASTPSRFHASRPKPELPVAACADRLVIGPRRVSSMEAELSECHPTSASSPRSSPGAFVSARVEEDVVEEGSVSTAVGRGDEAGCGGLTRWSWWGCR